MEIYHFFDKINNKKSLILRDFVDFIGVGDVEIYNFVDESNVVLIRI